jgi:hypothetical protein
MGLYVFDATYAPEQWTSAEKAPGPFTAALRSQTASVGCSLEAYWPYRNEGLLLVIRSESEATARHAFPMASLEKLAVIDDQQLVDLGEAIVNVAPEPKARCKDCQRKPPPHAKSCKWNT